MGARIGLRFLLEVPSGGLWVDDVKLEIVNGSVPLTRTWAPNQPVSLNFDPERK
jgi:hypothetical protein